MRLISRTKVENILSLGLNGVNICLYLLVVAAAIIKSLDASFSEVVICIYGGIIAALLVVNEIKSSEIPLEYFRFLTVYRGRSMIFIFFGCVVLDRGVVNIIAGTLNLVMGMIHMILSFVPSFPPPNPVMINWQNWKDFSAEGLDLARPKHFSVESNVAIRLKSPPPPVHHHIQPMHSLVTRQDTTPES